MLCFVVLCCVVLCCVVALCDWFASMLFNVAFFSVEL